MENNENARAAAQKEGSGKPKGEHETNHREAARRREKRMGAMVKLRKWEQKNLCLA